MTKFKGKGVYGAIAIGNVALFKRQDEQVRRTHVDDIEAEFARFEEAKELATEQLSEIYEKALK